MQSSFSRILCGLLTVPWLVGATSALREPHHSIYLDEEHNHRRNEEVRLGLDPLVHPHLQLLSLSLSTWGSKTRLAPESGDMEDINLRMTNDKSASTSMLRRLTSELKQASINHTLTIVSITAVVFCMLGFILYASESEDSENESPPKNQQQQASSTLVEQATAPRSAGSLTDLSEPADMDPLQLVEFSAGSWAAAYREASGPRREALELLFRCNIISTQEFAYSRVSQEHIDECVWIGRYMLKQKPLTEWVTLWQSAQQTFEDSVTACFTARTDARSTYGPMLGESTAPNSQSQVPLLDCHKAALQARDTEEGDDPYTTRSSLDLSNLMSPPSDFRSAVGRLCSSCGNTFMDDSAFCQKCGHLRSDAVPPDSQDSIGGDPDRSFSAPVPSTPPLRSLSPMILRCRDIMAAPPQEGVPAQRVPEGNPAQRGSSWRPPLAPMNNDISPLASMNNISPSMVPISPSIPSLSPAVSPVASFGEQAFASVPPMELGHSSQSPSSVVQRARAAMMQAGVEPPPQMDGGGAFRSRPLPNISPSIPTLSPAASPVASFGEQAFFASGTEADRGGGPTRSTLLAASPSEATSMQSTAAPSSSQPSVKLYGMQQGQAKPPLLPMSQQATGPGGEVLVAHMPMKPLGIPASGGRSPGGAGGGGGPGPGPGGGPVLLSPLVRIREDRMGGGVSPQSLSDVAQIPEDAQ